MDIAAASLHAGLQSVLDTALDAVVVIASDDRVLGWNRKAESVFGWDSSEAMGRRLTELIIPERHRDAHLRGMARYLATGEGPVLNRLIEIEAVRKDGSELKVELSITASDKFGHELFIGFLRDISDRTRLAEQRERLLRETNHRVKNSLSLVMSIAHLTAQKSSDIDQFMSAFTLRLQSLAAGHDLLVQSKWGETDVGAVASHILGAAVAAGRATCEGPALHIAAGKVVGLAMILHELFTNASKYGALSGEDGRLDVRWRRDSGEVVLEWHERGMVGVKAPTSEGFGHSLIEMTVKHDLGGSQILQWHPGGLTAVIKFPAGA
jgi:PAS domain S-box-containing protein